MKNALMALVVAATCVSTTAMAQLSARCYQDDQLATIDLAKGRNAWSRKCGYITPQREQYLNGETEYQVYVNGCNTYPNVPAGSTCTFYVPVTEADACIGGLTKLGTCVAGCFTPSQHLDFNGRLLTVPDAYESGVSTVTALTAGSQLDAIDFSQQPIRSYVAGDTQEDIFVLKSADGRRIEVTAEHPMLTGDGVMVKAKTLKVGDTLLGSDGKVLPLSSVTVFNYKGKVWNVRPESHDKTENVMSAEGFLTGSVRFQNEWAADDYRLSVRDALDVSGL
ncbi:Hint domain-containing protein [Pyxidicoccus caerfyrddinensis]|uniref:Hint domain-containing protein n=1 Tax=Pyxidicoccus caerfyrddinensis TaxID=2709663 RepID=UPI001967CBFD|nr:Hint domain-containing protein [Pyxidicoccus caerfyrddinensis]